MFRFYIISERYGLVAVAHDPDVAEQTALVAAVNSGRTVYLHDRLTELLPQRPFRAHLSDPSPTLVAT